MCIRTFIQFVIFISFFVLAACDKQEQKNNKLLLDSAAELMETDHKQALSLLNNINTNLLNEEEFAWFTLLQVRAWNMEDMNINSSDVSVLSAKDYFFNHNNVEKSVYASFIYAHIYFAKGDLNRALYFFLQADEWAEKADYKISHLSYSAIPYSIAVVYRKEQKYPESLFYLNKAIKFSHNKTGNYKRELYPLELKGIIFDLIDEPDSASATYSKALKIADLHNDTISKIRIFHNQSRLYNKLKNYTLAENISKQALALASPDDSISLGYIHMTLANTYNKSNQLDSAITTIHKAKDFIKVSNINYQATIHKILYEVEEKRGNTLKAKEYKELYEDYERQKNKKPDPKVFQLEEKIRQERADHVSFMVRMQVQSREHVQANRKTARTLLYILSGILMFTLSIYIIYSLKIKKLKQKGEQAINDKDREYEEIIAGMEQNHKQETLAIQQTYEEELARIEAEIHEVERRQVNQAFRKMLKEHEKVVKDWEKKYKDSERLCRKHVKQLEIWSKERKQIFKLHIQEIAVTIQRIRKIKETEQSLSAENIYAGKRQINELRKTISWDNIIALLTPAYSDMFKKLKEEFDDFEDSEYMFSCLYIVGAFSPTEIMLLMDINEEQYRNIKSSISYKLSKIGETLAYFRNYDKTVATWKKEALKKLVL